MTFPTVDLHIVAFALAVFNQVHMSPFPEEHVRPAYCPIHWLTWGSSGVSYAQWGLGGLISILRFSEERLQCVDLNSENNIFIPRILHRVFSQFIVFQLATGQVMSAMEE